MPSRCAMEVQRKRSPRPTLSAAGEARQMLLRIGINVGDVMVKNGDIFGDGVNVGARLQTLADAGGICVSRVFSKTRQACRLQPRGPGRAGRQEIARPVRALSLRLDGAGASDPDAPTPSRRRPPRKPTRLKSPSGTASSTVPARWNTASTSNAIRTALLPPRPTLAWPTRRTSRGHTNAGRGCRSQGDRAGRLGNRQGQHQRQTYEADLKK